VSRTRILVALLILVILMQLFPERAGVIQKVAIVGGGLYFLAWAAMRFLAQRKRQRAEFARSAADEAEYQAYRRELNAIRATYDPARDLNDPTSISPEYQSALTALHDKHQDMLARKFGPR
jgi:Skp family chaperone for outer membrane proteins